MAARALRILLIGVLFACGAIQAWAQAPMRRAVYYDSRYPGAWIGGGQAAAVRDYFTQRGYTSLDAAQLKVWMNDRIADGAPSLVVFSLDMAPDTVVEAVNATATLRRYLEAGGRVVWTGDVPLYYVGRRNFQNTRLLARGSREVLGINCDWGPLPEGLECEITPLGNTWGLRNSWTSTRMVSPSMVDRVLAVHPNGLPSAWARRYGQAPRIGWFIRTHDTTGPGSLPDLHRVAEYQEPDEPLPSPGGDFGDATAGAYARPDGAGGVLGRWLQLGLGGQPNPPNARRGTSDLSVAASSAGGRNTWRLNVRTNTSRGHVEWYVEPGYIKRDTETPAFVSVEYFDASAGVVLGLEYSAGTTAFRPARGAVVLRGINRWRRATWFLPDAKWDKLIRSTQINSGNDFRLYVLRGPNTGGGGIHIGSIRILTERQANLTLPPGRELVFSATREGVLETDLNPLVEELRASAPYLRAAGGTSHQNTVHWSRVAKEPGVYDFAFYDAIVAAHREMGLKWTPLLTLGPPNSLPDWFVDGGEWQGFVSLERNQTTAVPSIWDPRLREHVRGFLEAFGERYRDTGILQRVVLGISGVGGEARYPTTRPPTVTDSPRGPYPAYDAYWAGDPDAAANFREAMQTKYSTIAALNRAWGTQLGDFSAVKPFPPDRAPSLAARRDFVDWYIGSMLDYARFWLATAREFMPDVPLEIRTGGEGKPEHGTDFAALAQLAAEYKAGVRLAYPGSDYAGRFAASRLLDTAARFFGTTTSHEASGEISDEGLVARIYNAAPAVVRGLKEDGSWFGRPETFDAWLTQSRNLSPRPPRSGESAWPATTDVAMLYPQAHVSLFGSGFLEGQLLPAVRDLRTQVDFDLVSERMITAGALGRYRALVVGPGDLWDRAVLDRVLTWVRNGGLLIAPFRIDQGLLYPEVVRGGSRGLVFGRVAVVPDDHAFAASVRAALISQPDLSSLTRDALAASDPVTGVFATALSPGGLLLLNFSDVPVAREIRLGGQTQAVTLPPLSIVPVGGQ
jgi:hypothetical protein